MKIGINNIFTVFILLIMVFGGVVLPIYALIYWDMFANFNPIYIFIAMAFVLGVAVFVSILFNFRLLTISKDGISCYYPFLLKTQTIKWCDLVSADWKIYFAWKTETRNILIRSHAQSITFSDVEFENFEALTKQIPRGKQLLQQMNKTFYTPAKVKLTLGQMLFFTALLCLSLYFILGLPEALFFPLLICLNIFLLLATIKRVIKQVKILITK